MDRQAIIERLLEHYDHPRHHGPLAEADITLSGGIPDCGDMITIYLKVAASGEHVAALSFEGQGCTISQAAASLLSEQFQGQPLTLIETMDDSEVLDLLGREVVRARPRCATLALNTMKAAVQAYRRRH
ncbi:iron-sulfur cluster assembly scaffold protein [Candidatus Chloroploca sp. M-50]|uniref:Iron-sulfur cluster assembly scaffold protein n=1 Tax=Candidatus Chloroploca mongolica TaxID=2528176 RepID=A0ABS4D9G5_9CHLR|nr:iron-sulfur cluster assembly scaffold protein [Candidatus Chloroploca mongolica]MBP1466084.1 iron-sulfur cluster assembly scaffold protein [Candidatus Chloroploca mongolica]